MLNIKRIRNEKNMTLDDLAAKSGISKRMISVYEAGTSDITLNKLQQIASALNVSVLEVIGSPEIVGIVKEPDAVYRQKTDSNNLEIQQIPLYNMEASAGIVSLFKDQSQEAPIDFISIPNLPKCDGAIYVTGDSMYPLLKSGDIVMYKQINDLANVIYIWGEMYLVSLEMDSEEYVTVKYIQKSDVGADYIKLVSMNSNHQPIDVAKSRVRALALVKGSIRINSMI